MVFRKKTDKGPSHENEQSHYGQTEPYMNMPYGNVHPNNGIPSRPSSSREVTGPMYDPRQREIPQGYHRPPQHGNGMYGPMYPQMNPGYSPYPYDNTATAYPPTPPYINSYGQGGAAAYPGYPTFNQNASFPPNNRTFDGQMSGPALKTAKNKGDLKNLSFWQDDDNPHYQDDGEEIEEGTSPAKFVLSILILVVLSVILWLGYRFVTQPKNKNIPLIQAETTLYKHRPEHPGGEFFPHQDMLVYNQLVPHQGAVIQDERIMSQDYAYPTPEELQQHYPAPEYGNHQAYPQQSYMQEYGQQPPAQQAAPNLHQEYTQPQPQHNASSAITHTQAPEQKSDNITASQDVQNPTTQGNDLTSQADTSKNVTSEMETIQSIEEVKKNRTQSQIQANQDNMIDEQETVPEQPKQSVQIQTTPLKAGYYIQLGPVMPNTKSVENEWHRLRRKYTSELANFKPIYRNIEVGVRKKCRLLIGPFSHRNNALKKCMRIGNGCRVLQVGTPKR